MAQNLLNIAQEAGLELKKEAETNGGEYSSACPSSSCLGGVDRFRLWPFQEQSKCTGAYWCRQCGIKGDTIQFCIDFLNMTYSKALEWLEIDFSYRPSLFTPISKTAILDTKTSDLWKEHMTKLVIQSHEAIPQFPEMLEYLERRGLPKEAVDHYKLGFKDSESFYDKKFLGLEEDGKKVYIPSGITIPTMENGKVLRLKIRRPPNDSSLPKYLAIPGSLSGMNMIGDRSKESVIAVESELDAYAIHWIVKDKALVIAVGSNTKNPYGLAERLASQAKRLFVIHDNDAGGLLMLKKWEVLFPHTIGCTVPVGKDIGEAFQAKYDVYQWLLNKLS